MNLPHQSHRQQLLGKFKGQTVAGFLLESGRYDPDTGRYLTLGQAGSAGADTVIVDEASMLTEVMLAAVLEAVGGAKRTVLVGDHRQQPPIGAGRPFADSVMRLAPAGVESAFPRVGPGYAELTVRMRQPDKAGGAAADVRLAGWFAGGDPGPGEDELFTQLNTFGPTDRLQVFSWRTANECQQLLQSVLRAELQPMGGFDASLGGTKSEKGYHDFFWGTDPQRVGDAAERWEAKQKWYRANGILPEAEGGGPNGMLVVTTDDPNTGFDSTCVAEIVRRVLGVG